VTGRGAPWSPRRSSLAILLLLSLAGPASAYPDSGEPPAASASTLQVDWLVDGAVTGGALVAWGALELAKDSLTPATCRWCTAPGLDADVRRALAWSSPGAAKTASDLLLFAVPAGFAGYDLLAARDAGGLRRSAEDVLVVAEAVALTGVVSDAAKYAFARQRPYAVGRTLDAESRNSFWSEHTSLTFAAAAAGGSVARLRGYPGWGWVYGVGFGAATATAYFRLAADQHWFTDVVAGAAAGSAIGFLVPWLHSRTALPGAVSVMVLPSRVVVAGEL
jgi:membrane-associated phospholipid phosphatase